MPLLGTFTSSASSLAWLGERAPATGESAAELETSAWIWVAPVPVIPNQPLAPEPVDRCPAPTNAVATMGCGQGS
ncbi:MAG TPA: hypothetical protein VN892_04675, partial [Solirubrobacteraceae bacterium]|nr:hypothetical protein [Solirubrobacteraceae bacterium]